MGRDPGCSLNPQAHSECVLKVDKLLLNQLSTTTRNTQHGFLASDPQVPILFQHSGDPRVPWKPEERTPRAS